MLSKFKIHRVPIGYGIKSSIIPCVTFQFKTVTKIWFKLNFLHKQQPKKLNSNQITGDWIRIMQNEWPVRSPTEITSKIWYFFQNIQDNFFCLFLQLNSIQYVLKFKALRNARLVEYWKTWKSGWDFWRNFINFVHRQDTSRKGNKENEWCRKKGYQLLFYCPWSMEQFFNSSSSQRHMCDDSLLLYYYFFLHFGMYVKIVF